MTETLPNPPKKRRRWKSWLLALVIFLGGGAVGASLMAVGISRAVHHALIHPEEAPHRIAARLKRPLDLTPEQSIQIEKIIANRQQSLTKIRREVQPQVETQLDQLQTEIDGVLSPLQQTKWHEILHRVRENWLPPLPATLPAMSDQSQR